MLTVPESVLKRVQDRVLTLARKCEFDLADDISREIARYVYYMDVKHWEFKKKIQFIEEVTGGLGFHEHDITDLEAMVNVGRYIAWCEVVESDYVVFEIGTGLGRTLYTVISRVRPKVYITCDINPHMLAIALFDNPISEFQEALWRSEVKILLCDCCRLVHVLKDCMFDHAIHDGGPNPETNPRIFADHVLSRLLDIVKSGRTLSVFAGRSRRWVERLYTYFKSRQQVADVKTVSVPGSTVKVIHIVKR